MIFNMFLSIIYRANFYWTVEHSSEVEEALPESRMGLKDFFQITLNLITAWRKKPDDDLS